jgi:hypothetical protein
MPGYRLNHPRWVDRKGGHIESFFLKANDQNSPRAVWLKVTCLQKSPADGEVPEYWLDLWCCIFDKTSDYYEGARHRLPLSSLDFNDGVLAIETSDISVEFGARSGHFKTRIEDRHTTIDVNLSWQADTSSLGDEYTTFPYSWMLQGPIPKQKTITPIGLCYVNGEISCKEKHQQVHQWVGCQGHNWGRAHTPDYVWLQTVLFDDTGVVGTCEAFSGSVQLGARQLGPFSGLILRLRDKVYRFDRLVDTWNHHVEFTDSSYTLELKRNQLHVSLHATAEVDGIVCLGYEDPDSTMHYCMNSKLASAVIKITEGKHTRSFKATHCVALEWLSTVPKERVI